MASEVLGHQMPHVKLIHFERARKVSSSLILKMVPEIDFEGKVYIKGLKMIPDCCCFLVWFCCCCLFSVYHLELLFLFVCLFFVAFVFQYIYIYTTGKLLA